MIRQAKVPVRCRKGGDGRKAGLTQQPSATSRLRVGFMVLLVVAGLFPSIARLSPKPVQASGSYPATIAADHPVSYWRLNDTSGTTAADSVGMNAGQLQGGVTLGQTGPVLGGGAMAFDGTSGAVFFGQPSSLQPSTWSIEMWFNTTTTSSWATLMRSRAYGYNLGLGGGSPSTGGYTTTSSTFTAGSGGATDADGTWHHIVATKSSSAVSLYVDGIMVGSGPAGSGMYYSVPSGIALARDGDAGGAYFRGLLSEAAFYNYPLSATQVATHLAANGNLPTTPQSVTVTADVEKLNVSWSAATSPSGPLGGYVVTTVSDFGDVSRTILGPSTTSAAVSGLNSSKTYRVFVAGYNASGVGVSGTAPKATRPLIASGLNLGDPASFSSCCADQYPGTTAIADVDGDGIADLVSISFGSTVSVAKGNGDGSFQSPVSWAANGDTASVAVGDLGNGHPDIVTTDYWNSAFAGLSILMGNGDGTFAAPTTLADTCPQFVALGDLNGDGHLDIAVADPCVSQIHIFFGDGRGNFSAGPSLSTHGAVRSLAIADLNGDDRLDVVSADGAPPGADGATVTVFLNTGGGTFAAGLSYPIGNTYAVTNTVAVGDVNHDGAPDIVASNINCGYNGGDTLVLLNRGDGTFGSATSLNDGCTGSAAFADVNGDGTLDVVSVNPQGYYNSTSQVRVFMGNGDGTFQAAVMYPNGSASAQVLNIADLNGDKRDDVLLSNKDGTKELFLNGSTGPIGGAITLAQARGGGANYCFPCQGNEIRHGNLTSFPVDTATGNFWHAFDDLDLPGRSSVSIDRSYDATAAGINGPLGYGWQLNQGMSLSRSNALATITQENGSQVTFLENGTSWMPSAPRFIATLTHNADGTWTFVRQARETFMFGSSGQLTQEKDLNGYTTTLSYASGNLSSITDSAGRSLSFAWTGLHITAVTDSNVSGNTRTVSYAYDGTGNLSSVTDVNGGVTDFGYDSSHRIVLMRGPNFHRDGALPSSGPSSCTAPPAPHTVNNHYDASGRVDCQWDPNGKETTFAYSGSPQSASGGTTTTTDPVGNVTYETYQWGMRTSVTTGYGTSDAATTSFQYDPSTLAPTGITDSNGNVTSQTVDSSGNVLTVTDPLSRATTRTYNSLNEVLTTQDGNGVTTTNTYDRNGNLLTTSRPLTSTSATATNCQSPVTAVAMAQVTCYTYGDPSHPGDVTQVTDPDGKVTSFHYDANGYQDSVKDPLGHVTGTVRNNDGWLTASYSAKAGCTWGGSPPAGCSSSYETQYSYTIPGTSTIDEFGDIGTITDPLGHTTVSTYDADRNTTSVTDGNGNITTSAYDPADRRCWVLPGGSSTNGCSSPPTNARVTDYNADNTVADEKDGKGTAILTYGYNHRGQITSTKDALGNTTTYTLDLDGNVLTKLDPVSGATCSGTKVGCTTMAYDADNELKSVSYSDSSSENVTSITYDSDGQRTAMTDGTGSSSWSWDSLHRLTSYTNGNGATVSYGYTYGSGPTYDLKDQVRTITYPNSVGTAAQTWDDAGRLTSVADWSSNATTFSYDANNNETGQTVPSTTNVTDTSGFNAADQLTSISVSNGSMLFSAIYGRDSNAQVSSDTSVPASVGSYKYTALDQLCYAGSSGTAACSSPPAGSDAYAFDNADNLTANSGTTQQFNNADELCWTVSGSSGNACGTAPSGASTYGYDNKGNRTTTVPATGSVTCSTYDQGNRLTQIQTAKRSSCSGASAIGSYSYDGDGLRESKTVSGTTTQFAWDGHGGNLLQQKAGSTITSFLYGPGGRPFEQVSGSTTIYLHHDQLGSTRLITDAAGSAATATTITYGPYGATTSTVGTLSTPLMFTGQYLDRESGLYYLRARYYDPSTAQFLSRDPMVATTRSPYGYVGGNPLNGTDPSGQYVVGCFLGFRIDNGVTGPPDLPQFDSCPQPHLAAGPYLPGVMLPPLTFTCSDGDTACASVLAASQGAASANITCYSDDFCGFGPDCLAFPDRCSQSDYSLACQAGAFPVPIVTRRQHWPGEPPLRCGYDPASDDPEHARTGSGEYEAAWHPDCQPVDRPQLW